MLIPVLSLHMSDWALAWALSHRCGIQHEDLSHYTASGIGYLFAPRECVDYIWKI
jgi:hypothetical protein